MVELEEALYAPYMCREETSSIGGQNLLQKGIRVVTGKERCRETVRKFSAGPTPLQQREKNKE